MKNKNKLGVILSILLIIVSMVFIVVFEAGNEPIFNTEAEKIVLVETDIESKREYALGKGYVYKVRIDCKIKNISYDSLLVKMIYRVKTVDGSETYDIETQAKVMEGDSTYNAWAEFSHTTKDYGILEKVFASVNGEEAAEILPEKDMPLTTGAMVSSVFFIAGIVGIVVFAKKGKLIVVGDTDFDDYDDDDDDDDDDEKHKEIRALKNEIEKEKLESTLTEIRSKKGKVCEYCGTRNKGENTQCTNCGARLK